MADDDTHALARVSGRVLEIGASLRYDEYPSGVAIDAYEPGRKRRRVASASEDSKATVALIDAIPDRKYDAVVVPYVYETLNREKAQELSAIVGARLRIDGTLVVFERERGGFFARLLRKWTGTRIEDTNHGLRRESETVDGTVRISTYRRAVR